MSKFLQIFSLSEFTSWEEQFGKHKGQVNPYFERGYVDPCMYF